MKIVILGSTGMLGNAVTRHFVKLTNHSVLQSTRGFAGSGEFYFDANKSQLDQIPACDYIINCIGCVRQNKTYVDNDFWNLNSKFPISLANHCEKNNVRLIHITSDCVFSGQKSNYTEIDNHDSVDIYGLSKSLGEPQNCMSIRTSVVGEEIKGKYSLIEWLKSQNGNIVNGFVNHYWNGITSKQYALICDKIICDDLYEIGVRHVFSTTLSKYDLLEKCRKKYNLNVKIRPLECEISINRTLSSIYDLCSNLNIPNIDHMISMI